MKIIIKYYPANSVDRLVPNKTKILVPKNQDAFTIGFIRGKFGDYVPIPMKLLENLIDQLILFNKLQKGVKNAKRKSS